MSHGVTLFNILKNHMVTSLDCENAWNEYLSHLPESTYSSRYIRINPKLTGKVPTLDETGEMIPLQAKVQSILKHDERIKKLALQLIASTFYFQLLTPISEKTDGGFEAEVSRQYGVLASNRYTRGSERGKSGPVDRAPPDLKDLSRTATLKQYSDPSRGFGFFARKESTTGVEPASQQSVAPAAPVTASKAANSPPSAKPIAKHAFRALLWPVRARAESNNSGAVPQSINSLPQDRQFYQVDPVENARYQQWITGLQASTDRVVNTVTEGESLVARYSPGVYELPVNSVYELLGDCVPASASEMGAASAQMSSINQQ
ncbi:hypothetical protein VTN00DRAFT_6247 [Thermoascus crustaceus]|uniref:uncharacterized protein n=1 Tax=Thermoascus crustaceus TaxID=5088 RepID=UPI003743EFA0